MSLTFLDWLDRQVTHVHIFIDRRELGQEAKELIGRDLTYDELDNLETQLEKEAEERPHVTFTLSKEWVETAILNTDI